MLVTKKSERARRWADKRDARISTTLCKSGILCQEAVTGVNRFSTGFACRANHCLNVKISCNTAPWQNNCLRSFAGVPTGSVIKWVDRDSGYAKFLSRATDPRGNLAAIGDQQLA